MTQTVLTQVRCTVGNKDVKVSSVKRKEMDDMKQESDCKRQLKTLPVRSRINADKELWDKITFLKQDCRTSGVIPRLEPNFTKEETVSAYLCSPTTDHLSSGFMDLGWGCGYRNCQMLMSFLERQNEDGEPLLKSVLDIAGIQFLIEKAWKEGFDSLGAAQLDNRVFKTRKWIGTTEVYTLFTYLGIRSTIIDFHQPGPQKLHNDMLDWIQSYFTPAQTTEQTNVYITDRPPLYLQHQGHSRTVVGIEVLKSGKRNLILFDPGRRMLRSYRKVQEEDEDTVTSRFLAKIKHKSTLPSSMLRPFRVDAKTIAKHKQYSILVLGQVDYRNGNMIWDDQKSYLLNEDEREIMKNVTSLSVL
ncbi:peptidase family C78-domain-containing protein [Mucor mucedo]|uniref:peptidase family C78-domain-containing protein n=1 Tax=Mucor mucedo TaxID=29922 RepID=UPI00221E5FC3|nr:peptidase family C78-domain-containing protein [Mucor mucedo]KAI7882091.1 peptidase family C78-domain-containing protein [Mucor mucedo]